MSSSCWVIALKNTTCYQFHASKRHHSNNDPYHSPASPQGIYLEGKLLIKKRSMMEARWLSDHGQPLIHSYVWFVNGSRPKRGAFCRATPFDESMSPCHPDSLLSHHQLVTNTEIGTAVSNRINMKQITLYKCVDHHFLSLERDNISWLIDWWVKFCGF